MFWHQMNPIRWTSWFTKLGHRGPKPLHQFEWILQWIALAATIALVRRCTFLLMPSYLDKAERCKYWQFKLFSPIVVCLRSLFFRWKNDGNLDYKLYLQWARIYTSTWMSYIFISLGIVQRKVYRLGLHISISCWRWWL